MRTRTPSLVALSELIPGQEADLFALLSAKELATTRDGKPYAKVTFRDRRRELTFPIWQDAPLGEDCLKRWTPGAFYKLRATLRETSYGPQLESSRIREVCADDAADGFSESDFVPHSRFDPQVMFRELLFIAGEQIQNSALRTLVTTIYETHREALLILPAATRNHHAFWGGLLEHTLSVTRTAILLADRYLQEYQGEDLALNKDLVVAGALLHDIGKLHEIEPHFDGARYTPEGRLIGHILQGRDLVRDAAQQIPLDRDLLLRLEHIIVSHQRLPEWGSPKPPMTPEALIVHYADDLDAKFHMMFVALRDDPNPGPITSNKNQLYQYLYRGPQPPEK
jgi:3'-5' exoribonuclease